MIENLRMDITLIIPLVLQMVGLLFIVLLDSYIRREQRRIMLIIIAVVISLIVQNFIGYLLDLDGTMPYARTVDGIYGYIMRPVVLILFCYLVNDRRKYTFAWVLLGINTALYLTAFFSRLTFWIDETNRFHRGIFGYSCHVASALILLELTTVTIMRYGRDERPNIIISLTNAGLIVVSVVVDTTVDYREYPATYLTMATVTACVFFYIWMHLQFVREHEDDMRAKQRIQIMISQIQPHFLFNTLSTIQALCEIAPDKAGEVTEKFAAYLRQNIDSLSQDNLIPFEKELEHTKTYADIEMVRFPHIEMKYFIEDDDFYIPALTIQPMVENAIRHGVRGRKKGAVVVVMSKMVDNVHEIIVSDNGKGIDESEKDGATMDGTHIGIQNVRERIEKMCGGTVSIESREGRGVIVRIRIPKWGGEALNAGDLRG